MTQGFVLRQLPKASEELAHQKTDASRLIHNSSKLETTLMSFNRRMDGLYSYTMKYYGVIKKELLFATHELISHIT